MTRPDVAAVARPIWRLPLCWAGLCQTFNTNSDENGVWGECGLCGKRVGYVDRATLRRYADAEYEREQAAVHHLTEGASDGE